MRRLKNLDVMEVSLVKAGANGKKYAVVKNKQGAAMAIDGSALLDQFNRIPKARIEAIQAVAKSAKARVRKADDLEDGVAPSDAPPDGDIAQDGDELSENAQNAIKAAGRILAPYSEELNRGVMDALGDALELEDDATDDAADEASDVAEDAVDKADDDDDDKSDDDDDDVNKADDDDDDDKKTEGPTDNEVEAAAKADDDDDDTNDDDDDVNKADDDLADNMPDFEDAEDGDKAEALAAARAAFSDVMKRKTAKSKAQKDADGPGVGGDKDVEEKDLPIEKSAARIAKSAMAKLKGFSKTQEAGLTEVLKSQFARMAELETKHKQAVAKSAELQTSLLRREFIAKAATDYAALGNATSLGEQMMRLHQKDPEGLKAWEAVLKTANAAAASGGEAGLFGELGTRMGSGLGGLGDADAKIKAHVDGRVEKSAGRSREQIEAEFLDTPVGRELYKQSRQQAEKGKR